MKKMPLEVANFPVGLDEALQDFETKIRSSTHNRSVSIFGIVGNEGIGKTTLAKELYNRKSSSISRSSFLFNVRDAASTNSLHKLQEKLLKDLRIQRSEIHDIHQGMGMLARHLRGMSVLIVVDDVDHVDQIEALLPHEIMHDLGEGSFIIVTAREKKTLESWGICCIYQMKLLDRFNAKQLFCRHAFLQPYSQLGFEHPVEMSHSLKVLIERFVDVCNGLPSSLKAFGAMVNGQPEAYWEDQLQKILSKKAPFEVAMLRVERGDEVQDDVHVVEIVGNDWKEELVASAGDLVWLRWREFNGTHLPWWLSLINLRGLQLWQVNVQPPLQLRELIFDLAGSTCFKGLPRSIGHLRHLKRIVLNGSGNGMRRLPEELCHLASLEILQLSDFAQLSSLPDHFGELMNLRILVFSGVQLAALPDSFKKLRLLQSLDISNSQSFFFTSEMLDDLEYMTELHILRISFCPQLVNLPHLTTQVYLRELDLRCTGLREFPTNTSQLSKLETLVTGSDNLTSVPDSLGELSCLTSLSIYDCRKLKSLPEAVGRLSNLRSLEIQDTPVQELGLGMGSPLECNLKSLKYLSLFNTGVRIKSISDYCCPSLETLQLSRNNHLAVVRDLPKTCRELIPEGCEKMWAMTGIWYLLNLENLVITDCPKLKVLPIRAHIFSVGRRITVRGCPTAAIDIVGNDGVIETVTQEDERFI